MDYGIVTRDGNLNADGGAVAKGPNGYDGHVTFYVEVDDIDAALAKAERLGGAEGHVIGLVQSGF